MSQKVNLIDETGAIVAVAQVDRKQELFSGSIDLRNMPSDMLRTFQEYEDVVNDQTFSLLDQIQDDVERLHLKVQFENGRQEVLDDLQIYPSDSVLSFKVKTAVAAAANPTNGNGAARVNNQAN